MGREYRERKTLEAEDLLNMAQSYMKQKFEEEVWKAHIHTPVESVHSKGQKHERIM